LPNILANLSRGFVTRRVENLITAFSTGRVENQWRPIRERQIKLAEIGKIRRGKPLPYRSVKTFVLNERVSSARSGCLG